MNIQTSLKERITGTLIFTVSLCYFSYLVFEMSADTITGVVNFLFGSNFNKTPNLRWPDIYSGLMMAFSFMVLMLYIFWTRFGRKVKNDEQMNREQGLKNRSFSLKARIAGILCMSILIPATLLTFYLFFYIIRLAVEGIEGYNPKELIGFGLAITFLIFSMLYIYWTRFGRVNYTIGKIAHVL